MGSIPLFILFFGLEHALSATRPIPITKKEASNTVEQVFEAIKAAMEGGNSLKMSFDD